MPDVPAGCAYRLSSLEPVVAGWIRVEYKYGGWSLWVGHRHHSGVAGDCRTDEYHSLTTDELNDVLYATIATWGPFCELGGRGEEFDERPV